MLNNNNDNNNMTLNFYSLPLLPEFFNFGTKKNTIVPWQLQKQNKIQRTSFLWRKMKNLLNKCWADITFCRQTDPWGIFEGFIFRDPLELTTTDNRWLKSHWKKNQRSLGIQPIEALKLGFRLGLEPKVKVRVRAWG